MGRGQKHPNRGAKRYRALQEVAVELIHQTSPHELLSFILHKAVGLSVCDAGSLYLAKDNRGLLFEVAINSSVDFRFEQKEIPIGSNGIAAYAFRSGESMRVDDVYQVRQDAPFHFDPTFDMKTEYRTRSVMVQPLISSKGDMLGVIQLINRKRKFNQKWPSHDRVKVQSMPSFSDEDEELLKSFAALASASIEKANLYKDIERLFQGFIRASVKAIESRDPATRGHSDRVAVLTIDLAKKVSDCQDEDLRLIEFSDKSLEELHCAALLHDFGKISVAEATLLKSNKLIDEDLNRIKERIQKFRYCEEIQILRGELDELMSQGRSPSEIEKAQLEKKLKGRVSQLDQYWEYIEELNQPSVLDVKKTEELDRLRVVEFSLTDGQQQKLLSEHELKLLSIQKGSLSPEERKEIESHVTSTYHFLMEIPWTREFSRVPEIVFAHHEMMDGSGYPRGLRGDAIPIQARLITICDIFDALVAADRPYKKAIPVSQALNILEQECKAGKLDRRLFRIFSQERIYENSEFITLNRAKEAA